MNIKAQGENGYRCGFRIVIVIEDYMKQSIVDIVLAYYMKLMNNSGQFILVDDAYKSNIGRKRVCGFRRV